MDNIQKYIGLPYLKGGTDFPKVDCFGLIALIYKNELNQYVPPFTTKASELMSARSINKEFNSRIQNEWIKVEEPSEYSVIAISSIMIKDMVDHVGMYIGNGKMIHSDKNIGYSCIERLKNYRNKIVGYYDFKR